METLIVCSQDFILTVITFYLGQASTGCARLKSHYLKWSHMITDADPSKYKGNLLRFTYNLTSKCIKSVFVFCFLRKETVDSKLTCIEYMISLNICSGNSFANHKLRESINLKIGRWIRECDYIMQKRSNCAKTVKKKYGKIWI